MRSDTILATDWTFAEGFDPGWTAAASGGVPVDLPHNAVELPLTYFDETSYQRRFTYQRHIAWEERFSDREVRLVFEGAMADARVWAGGIEIARHADGYTPFEAVLTPHLTREGVLVTVRIDGTENPLIPPFGGQIDYLTYAGLYREVRLVVTPRRRIANVKIETPDPLARTKTVTARVSLAGRSDGPARLTARLVAPDGGEVARQAVEVAEDSTDIAFTGVAGLPLWSPQSPALCTLELSLDTAAGTDTLATRFGIREARFTTQGFVLNGQPMKLLGLNRHQSYPYSGYAQGPKSQIRDADFLRHDLGCNIVRTAHYPQSRAFLDRCDEIGLLVFEEIPGWQHIGGPEWKAEAVRNVERMIRRDWNHPSIVIWGVRINESRDDHAFYSETNRTARALDPTRATGGVRCIAESELMEDVYTMNDFILGEFELPDTNRPRTALRPQAEVTGLTRRVPYLITEYGGHMFPTKAGDPEQRQAEHVTRHLEVMNAMYGDPEISGCIGWCMSDYNTHKDFGSGDRVCHHGVSTIFREPKFAGYAYASQRDPSERVVLEPVTHFARGERNIGGVLPLIVLTNCDEVELRYGDDDDVVTRVGPDRARFAHLPHPPVIIDHRHFSPAEMGRWGMRWEAASITGYVGGRVAATRRYVPDPLPTTLQAVPDADILDAAARDETRVIVRALDQAGNVLPFLADHVQIDVAGPARRIGPATSPLRGGTTGFWLRATGAAGPIRVTLRTTRFAPVTFDIFAE